MRNIFEGLAWGGCWVVLLGDHRASQAALTVKKPPANAGDIRDEGLIPGSGRSPGGGPGNPLRIHTCRIPMDRGAWWATVHRVAKNQIQLNFLSTEALTYLFHTSLSPLEKEMATHSSILAWRIPGTEEPGGLPSMGSHSRTPLKRLGSSNLSP